MRQTWMKRALVAGAATVLGAVMALPAGAVPSHWVIDQQNEYFSYPHAWACPIGDTGGMLQSITPGVDEWAGFDVELLYATSLGGAEVVMHVRTGSTLGPIIGSAAAILPAAENSNTVEFEFPTPLSVPSGGTVYLELPNQDIYWAANDSDSYAPGEGWATCSSQDPFSFASRGRTVDFVFTTYEAGPITDSDGDGLEDDRDPDTVGDAVAALPDSAFHAPGHRSAIEAQLESAEADIVAGDLAEARTKLEHLRRHVDGCETGTGPDGNDWIVDCAAQADIRALIDTLLAAL